MRNFILILTGLLCLASCSTPVRISRGQHWILDYGNPYQKGCDNCPPPKRVVVLKIKQGWVRLRDVSSGKVECMNELTFRYGAHLESTTYRSIVLYETLPGEWRNVDKDGMTVEDLWKPGVEGQTKDFHEMAYRYDHHGWHLYFPPVRTLTFDSGITWTTSATSAPTMTTKILSFDFPAPTPTPTPETLPTITGTFP